MENSDYRGYRSKIARALFVGACVSPLAHSLPARPKRCNSSSIHCGRRCRRAVGFGTRSVA